MKRYIKKILFVKWMIVLIVLGYFFITTSVSLQSIADWIKNFVESLGFWGPVVYIIIYAIRPLVFFPATLLTAISGALFGPVYGIMYTIVGENISANFSFIVGRYFGTGLMKVLKNNNRFVHITECRFKEHGFMAVLIMRLTYFPFDLVGYASGICNIKQKEFALGTFIGIIPGLITFVLLGSSFSDPRNLFLALLFFVVGLMIAKYIKKKKIMKKEFENCVED